MDRGLISNSHGYLPSTSKRGLLISFLIPGIMLASVFTYGRIHDTKAFNDFTGKVYSGNRPTDHVTGLHLIVSDIPLVCWGTILLQRVSFLCSG